MNIIKYSTNRQKKSIKALPVFKVMFVFAFIFLAFSLDVIAQPPPPNGGGNPSCWPPPCVPIDGGITWLLLAGVGYGIRRKWKNSDF